MIKVAGVALLCCVAWCGAAILSDGWYKIQCNTKYAGLQGWKGSSSGSQVGLSSPQDNNQYYWFVQSFGNGNYRITFTGQGSQSYVEANPSSELALLQSYKNIQEQFWRIDELGYGQYRISNGAKSVEAFPTSNNVKLKDSQEDPDQKWMFVRL